MLARRPTLDRATVKALLALTKTRCNASDRALRPPITPSAIYHWMTSISSMQSLNWTDFTALLLLKQ